MSRTGIAAALFSSLMQQLLPVGMIQLLRLSQIATIGVAISCLCGCSKSEVQVAPPSPSQATRVPAATPAGQTAAERIVEIDRLLAAPLSGRPDDADQRSLLRAEREALIASGQVPYRMRSQPVVSRNRAEQPNPSTVTQRLANGDAVNYASPTTQNGRITVAPNSQASSLSYLEQMTPTERERYYKTLRLQNSRRIEVDVRHY
ncbi:MAG: hypothetical protein QOI96_643 [Verrucomicrobiota bacterium]|jgi:hypothetical protein